MRTLNRNKQKMFYSLYLGETPVYDSYVDGDGFEHKVDTGEKKASYSMPKVFYGNIAMSGGESEAVEFGLNLADYQAVLIMAKNTLPIDETSLIWLNTTPQYDTDGTPDQYSADYSVVKVSPSLNVDKYVLKKVVK